MNKIYHFLGSIKFGIFLLLIYAISIATATFIENDFGTASANELIYRANWFNILHLLLVGNMISIFIKFKMYRLKKLSIFIFHLSFVIIIIGAAITRFMSYEGIMHIRENETSDLIVTYNTHLNISIDDNNLKYDLSIPVNFNEISGANLDEDIKFENQNINIKTLKFIPNASESIVQSDTGKYIIAFAISGATGREDVYIKEGERKTFNHQVFNFSNTIKENAINFLNTDSGLFILSHYPTVVQNMTDTLFKNYKTQEIIPLKEKKLYRWKIYNMVISKIYDQSITVFQTQVDKNQFPLDAVKLRISDGKDKKDIYIFGKSTHIGQSSEFEMNQLNYKISYGSDTIKLPFNLTLNQFKLERYPGSMSPASYESYITLQDNRKNIIEKHRIYMNNVLYHDGIRFYQSSYDADEHGTILSVNKDSMGTNITYLGYLLLAIGMFLNIFDKNSRFRLLSKKVKDLSSKSAVSLFLVVFFSFSSLSLKSQNKLPENNIPQINKEHAAKFGQLLVQDKGGRIKPINTLATEILLKVSKRSSYKNLNAEQVFLGMISSPQIWAKEAIIKIKNPDLIKHLNIKTNHIALADLFNNRAEYILQKEVANAYAKAPSKQSKYDKAIIKLDEKINILYMTLNSDLLNIFPKINQADHKWYNPNNARSIFKGEDSLFIFNVFRLYHQDLQIGLKTNNWAKADSSLNFIKIYQEKAGSDVLISNTKRDAEIFYNKSNIFRHLFEFYFTIGLIFLVLLFIKLLFDKLNLKYLVYSFVGLIIIAFIAQTFGLILRWYISGHAPWSNGYESMIYISWATMLSGLIFTKSSKIALAATTILSGMILLVAHLSWIDPEITNLVPVLQSYWLTIHVAVITASYGFLALGALLGFINLLIMGLQEEKNKTRLDQKIKQLTYINEMTLIAGLFLLSVGTFLGGVWANESWGRYWGWDSKETWALITMLIYAFVLHIRFIPKLKSIYTFNLLSLISFSTVIMTYFGVNYYLSGLHSYAKGDPVPIPMFVYYTLTIIFLLAVFAFNRNLRWKKDMSNS